MEEGGVGIVFHASRAGRVLVVKSLIQGGAAEKSGAVQVGYQIIAVDDQDVTNASLEEVAGLLRGPLHSAVQLRFLETRDIHLVIERTVTTAGDQATVGIQWQQGSADLVVDKIHPDYSGFGGSPKPGDRLIRIQGESIDNMGDEEVKRRLSGAIDSSIRLDFARGVAHHSVTLTRQPLVLVANSRNAPPTVQAGDSSIVSDVNGSGPETIISSSFKDVKLTESPASSSSPNKSPADENHQPRKILPNTMQDYSNLADKQSLQMHVSESKTGSPLTQDLSPPATQKAAPATTGKEEDSVNKQLVDIARRLKQELEAQSVEIMNLKATHKSEIEGLQRTHMEECKRYEAKMEMASLQPNQGSPSSELQRVQSLLETAQEDLKKKESELTSVKTVMTRRAESAGDTMKKMDELSNEKDGLAAKCSHLAQSLETAEQTIQQLKSTREIDETNLRNAADVALKWQMQEVERQATSAKAELQTKCLEVNNAQETIKMQAQTLVREQKAHEASQSKLQEALAELNRLRLSNQDYDAVANKTKKLYEESTQELATQRKKVAELTAEVDYGKTRLEQTETAYLKKLEETETEWERKYLKAESEWNSQAQLQKTQIEELEKNLAEAKSIADSLNAKNIEMEAHEVEQKKKVEQLEAQSTLQEQRIVELEESNQQSQEKVEKLTEATQAWKEQLTAAQKTIESQAKALAEERKCSEDWLEKAERLEKQVEALEQEQSELKRIKAEHELDQERLQQFEALQQHIQVEAQRRNQMMQQIAGQVPYPQLLAMLQDSKTSVSNLQGVVQGKTKQIATLQQQLHKAQKVREMSVDAEKQLFRLKESLDWKTIAMQQMSNVLTTCQGTVQEQDLQEEIANALAIAQQYMKSPEFTVSPPRKQQEETFTEETADFDELPPMPVDTRTAPVDSANLASVGAGGSAAVGIQGQYPMHSHPQNVVPNLQNYPQQSGAPGAAYTSQNQQSGANLQQLAGGVGGAYSSQTTYNAASAQQAQQAIFQAHMMQAHSQHPQAMQGQVAQPFSHPGAISIPSGQPGQQGQPQALQASQQAAPGGIPYQMSPDAIQQHQAAQAAMGLTQSQRMVNPPQQAEEKRASKLTTYEL